MKRLPSLRPWGFAVTVTVIVLASSWLPRLAVGAIEDARAVGPETLICAGDEPPTFHPHASRVRELDIDHERVSVLLPPHYLGSKRRYAVLYLLAGGNNNQNGWLQRSDLVRYTQGLPQREQAIVVTPDPGLGGFYVDWEDGSHDWETLIIDRVLPAIDRRFRTISDRAHRAIAGASMGGWGSAYYGFKYHRLFSIVGTFSGGDEDATPDEQAIFLSDVLEQRTCEDGLPIGSYDPFGMMGNPITLPGAWRADDPVSHASLFRRSRVFLTVGNGVPCDATDALAVVASHGIDTAIETIAHHATLDFHQALDRNDVQNVFDSYGCGVHTGRYFQRDIHAFWPWLTRWLREGPP